MKTPYELLIGMLPFKVGKFTMGKSKLSLLSKIDVDIRPFLMTSNRSRKGDVVPSESSGTNFKFFRIDV